jgi:uncharacterized protein YbaP (TraB family)
MRDNDSLLKAYSGTPMDVAFLNKGKETGKQITTLETMEEQMHMLFNSLTIKEQIEQLKLFIRNYDESRQLGNDLILYYVKKDLGSIEKMADHTMSFTGNSEYLLKNRNDA